MEQKYVILDQNNKAINIVIWNGDTNTWQPPANTTVTLLEDVDPSVFVKEESPVIEEDIQY